MKFTCTLLATAITAAPLHAAVLVSDVFADGVSTNHDLANNSLQVFYGRNTTNTRTDAAGSVTFGVTNTGSDAYWAHFTEAGAPVTLANDGDTLTVRVVFSINIVATGNTDIRFGIGDSRGTRNTTDLGGGQNNAAFADDSFYGGIFAVTGTGSPFRISKRIAVPSSPNNPFNAGADALTLTTDASGTGTRQPLQSGVDYTFTYTIRRDNTAGKMIMTVSLSGGGITTPYEWTAADDGLQGTAPGLNTTFDWVTFRIPGSSLCSTIALKKIEAEKTPGSDPYSAWVSGFGLDPAGDGARTGDPDKDGFTNAEENLYGLTPNAADTPGTGLISETLSSGNMVVKFTRSTAAVVTWKVETSPTVTAPWSEAIHGQNGVTISTVPQAGNKEEVTVTIPQGGAPRKFARVNAS